MGLFRKSKTVVAVHRYDGPGAKTGDQCASFNIYEYEDGSCKTIEFDRSGKRLAEYAGEPQFADGRTPEALTEGQPPRSKPRS